MDLVFLARLLNTIRAFLIDNVGDFLVNSSEKIFLSHLDISYLKQRAWTEESFIHDPGANMEHEPYILRVIESKKNLQKGRDPS